MSPLPPWLQRLFKKKRGENDRAFASDVQGLELSSENPASNAQHGSSLPSGRRSTDKYNSELYDRWLSLSFREQQVIALTCLGYKNDQIAFKLGLSTTTVKSYIQKVCNKLDLHSKTEIRLTFAGWDFSKFR
jgi:DNA-binding NarL/FixJ family response regulator